MSWDQLRLEHVTDIAWWTVDELDSHDVVFTPRRLPELVAQSSPRAHRQSQ